MWSRAFDKWLHLIKVVWLWKDRAPEIISGTGATRLVLRAALHEGDMRFSREERFELLAGSTA